jgi:hypothetical protein
MKNSYIYNEINGLNCNHELVKIYRHVILNTDYNSVEIKNLIETIFRKTFRIIPGKEDTFVEIKRILMKIRKKLDITNEEFGISYDIKEETILPIE